MLKQKFAIGLIALFFGLLSATRAQETCASNSRLPYEWPAQRNWLITTNLFSGKILNTLTGATTTTGDAWDPVQAYEGVTAVSDDSGNLLFFSAGRTIQAPDGTVLYSGLLTGNEGGSTSTKGSASQGVMAIRHPLNPDHYYFLTTDDALTGVSNGLNYAVIDKDGNMVQNTTRLGSFRTTEGIAATWHANDVDIWVTVTEAGSTNIRSYLLKCDGFDATGVVSPVGIATGYSDAERGGVAFSWDSQYFAAGFGSTSGADRVRLYDFDNSTGTLTFNRGIGSSMSSAGGFAYDLTFSPDNSRVLGSTNTGQVFSMNVATGAGSSVRAASGSHSAIEIGADGRLYRATLGTTTKILTGNLNNGSALGQSAVTGTSGSRGLTTMFLPPAEEPDIQEVGPYCNTDPAVDLNTLWICAGTDAEDPTENPLAYTGTGITNRATGIFNPATAGPGVHQIVFEYCSVNDTIWITVNDCATCESELDDQTPEICVGETFTLDPLVTNASADGVWTIDSMPAGTSPLITTGADTVFDASNLSVTAGTYKLLFTVTDGAEVCYDSVYIVVNPLPVVDLGLDQKICDDGSTVTFDAGVHTSYLWNDGSTNQTLVASTAGDYWVQVTNASGCSDTDTVALIINALPVVDLGTDQTICAGESVTFDPGTFTTYLWNDASTNQTLVANSAGDYVVKITDANGCADSDSVVLIVNALPVVDLGVDQTICAGESVTFDAGVFTTYLWNDASTNQTLVANTAGDYVVKVTDVNGCTDSDSVVLIINALPVVDLGADQSICAGESYSFDAGVFTTYLWNDASTNQTLVATTAGDYVVKITDANGCTDSDSVVLTINALPVVDLGTDQSICAGESYTFDAGVFTTYLWNDASTNQTLVANSAGDYVVKVTDVNGCADSDSVVLAINALPIVDLGNDTAVCAGESVTFDAGLFTTYLWNDASTNQTLVASTAGDYVVKVTDINGCADSDSVVLTINALPIVDLGNDTAVCADGSTVTFDAGVFTTYLWNDASTNQTLLASSAGDYVVKVTDVNGCADSDSVVLTINALPVVDLGPDQTVCDGESYTFDAGVFTTYLWNDASTNQTLLASTAGDYVVKVTDANGCADSDSVVLNINALPIVDLGNDTAVCAGESLTFDAGLFTTYLWNDASTNQTLLANTAGDYVVKVTDINGCADSDSVVLTINALPIVDLGNDTAVCADGSTVTFDAGVFTTYLWNDASTNQTLLASSAGDYVVKVTDVNGCADSDSVVLTINALPVVDLGPDQTVCDGESYTFDAGVFTTYLWNDASTNQTLLASTAGDYVVKVTDANGCADSDSVVLNINALPIVDLGNDTAVCAGESLTFDAGLFTTYLWNDASTNQTLLANTAGDYVVKVTDINGCADSDSVVLTINALPIPDLGPDTEICEGGLGIIFDAGLFDSYVWQPRLETTQQITTDSAGVYSVEVTDASGCIGVDTVELLVNPNPIVDLGPDRTICPGSSVQLDAGPGFVNYVWNDATTNQTKDINDSNAGEYSVLVIDANSCSGRDTVEVIVAAELSVNLGNDTSFCDGNSITVDAGNIAGATYAWAPNNETTQTIDISTTGEYSVLITDPMGCEGRDTIEVTVNANPMVDLGPDVTVCPGTDSLFTVGPGWSAITWSDASVNENLVLNTTGKYYVDVVDANGCTATDTAEFAYFAGATLDLGSDITICPGTNANFDAGLFTSYTWHDGSNLQTYTTTIAEKIWVDVVDANGCEAVDTAEVFMANSLPVTLGNDTAICDGESVTIQSGYPVLGYTFTWAPNGEVTNEITVSTSGTYDVLVENAAGCTGRDTIVVTVNNLPVVDLGPDKEICESGDVGRGRG